MLASVLVKLIKAWLAIIVEIVVARKVSFSSFGYHWLECGSVDKSV